MRDVKFLIGDAKFAILKFNARFKLHICKLEALGMIASVDMGWWYRLQKAGWNNRV